MIHSPEIGGELLVEAPVAPVHAEPRITSEQISQRVSGQRVIVLACEGEWLRIRGEDGYEGWMHRGYLLGPAPGSDWAPLCSLGCRTRRADGAARHLPAGAYLLPQERLESGEALDVVVLRSRFPAERHAVVQSAIELFAGTSYEWGGITPWGADCSGFVQTVFRLHGMTLPRDARLQAELGERIGSIAACGPGDLLFFSEREEGRITHVGIASGGGAMVHLALGRGGHALDQLLDPPDPYSGTLAQRFQFARRVLPR